VRGHVSTLWVQKWQRYVGGLERVAAGLG
jgi:hypothetical protein